MNALEQFGYVKQPTDEYTDEGCTIYNRTSDKFEEKIVMDKTDESAIKTFMHPTLDGRHADYINKAELKAILELMEVAE